MSNVSCIRSSKKARKITLIIMDSFFYLVHQDTNKIEKCDRII